MFIIVLPGEWDSPKVVTLKYFPNELIKINYFILDTNFFDHKNLIFINRKIEK